MTVISMQVHVGTGTTVLAEYSGRTGIPAPGLGFGRPAVIHLLYLVIVLSASLMGPGWCLEKH